MLVHFVVVWLSQNGVVGMDFGFGGFVVVVSWLSWRSVYEFVIVCFGKTAVVLFVVSAAFPCGGSVGDSWSGRARSRRRGFRVFVSLCVGSFCCSS
mgnify:CR=1 FL=1